MTESALKVKYMNKKEICLAAIKATEKSYSPYSECRVGAALLCKNGRIFTGCNIENAAFSPTVCAERTAIFKAVSEGEREFSAIAVAGKKGDKITGIFPPCGVCRQVLSEFCSADMPVLLVSSEQGNFEEYTLGQLLPKSFNLEK